MKKVLDRPKNPDAVRLGSKGGKRWWNSLTEEERAARIAKLIASRAKPAPA